MRNTITLGNLSEVDLEALDINGDIKPESEMEFQNAIDTAVDLTQEPLGNIPEPIEEPNYNPSPQFIPGPGGI